MNELGLPNTLTQTACRVALCAALWALASPGMAQTVYRIVGPDGKVTFSDKPPEAASKLSAASRSPDAAKADETALPYDLRQIVNRYPVLLYTSTGCAPCGQGRSLLTGRGIPFTEKTVNTGDDVDALKRIAGDSSVPFLSIGGQQIKGYSDSEWTQFLNAAGYPQSSALPASYRRPAATPLVAVQKPTLAAKPDTTPPEVPVPPLPPPAPINSTNPAGIQF